MKKIVNNRAPSSDGAGCPYPIIDREKEMREKYEAVSVLESIPKLKLTNCTNRYNNKIHCIS